MNLYIFYGLSVIMIFSSLMVLISKTPIHSLLYLILSFFTLAGHYILLNAQFLAVVHIIVYAGAIMVLFLFTVMLLNLNNVAEGRKSKLSQIAAAVAAGMLLVSLIGGMKGLVLKPDFDPATLQIGTVQNLGKVLFNKYLLPFELASVLFISAMVGAVMLGRKEMNY
jgi:NADH-quinone oxidoreductase subunit J